MAISKRSICYRIDGGPCQQGWYDALVCATPTGGQPIYDAETNLPVVGATVVACGDCPDEVVIAGPITVTSVPPTPFPVAAADCDGAVVPVNVTAVVQSVPMPGVVQLVQLCNPPAATRYERERSVLCDPATGARVFVLTIWDEEAAPGTAPAVEAYNLDGSVYAGVVQALVACPDVDVEAEPVDFCDNGTPFIRWFMLRNGQLTGGFFDTGIDGTPYAATAPVRGECVAAELPLQTFGVDVTGPYSAADIMAATGATKLRSVTFLNIGAVNVPVTDDFGNVSTLPRNGGSRTWSAFERSAQQDTLGASALAVDATGSLVVVTAIVS